MIKADYHMRLNSIDNFAEHLVDICEAVKPVFSIIDGIEGMEGDGPSAGEKRHVGLILASNSPYALDGVASKIIGIDSSIVPTIKAASLRNLYDGSLKDIKIKGVQPAEINVEPFKLPKSVNVNFVGGRVPRVVEKMILNNLRPKPVFNYELCVSCGDCKRSCPPGIIDMSSGKPVPDLSKCIRCFCCHELCPKKAVDIKKHWLYDKVLKK
jgi:heterodisulfide reductase subunit A-like polyferredoxin